MTLTFLVELVAEALILAIVVRSLLSWFPGVRALAPVSAFLDEAVTPILRPIQRRMRPMAGFDFSPFVAIFLIYVAESLVLTLLAGH